MQSIVGYATTQSTSEADSKGAKNESNYFKGSRLTIGTQSVFEVLSLEQRLDVDQTTIFSKSSRAKLGACRADASNLCATLAENTF